MTLAQLSSELDDVQAHVTLKGYVIYGGVLKDVPECIRKYEMKSLKWTSDNTVSICLEF